MPRITTGVVSLVGSLCLLSGVCLLGVVLRGGAEGTGGACGSEVGRGTLQDCGGGGVGADPVPAGKVVLTTVDRVFAGWLGNLTSVFPFEDEGVGVGGTSGGGSCVTPCEVDGPCSFTINSSAQLLPYSRATHFTRASFEAKDFVTDPFFLIAHSLSVFLGAALILKLLVISLTSLIKVIFIKLCLFDLKILHQLSLSGWQRNRMRGLKKQYK